MPETQSARLGLADAELSKAGWPFGSDNTQTVSTAQALAGPRFERQVEHLHRLGPRAVGEFLAEIATATGQPALIAARLEEYFRLDPEILRAVGGDRFPPSVLGIVR